MDDTPPVRYALRHSYQSCIDMLLGGKGWMNGQSPTRSLTSRRSFLPTAFSSWNPNSTGMVLQLRPDDDGFPCENEGVWETASTSTIKRDRQIADFATASDHLKSCWKSHTETGSRSLENLLSQPNVDHFDKSTISLDTLQPTSNRHFQQQPSSPRLAGTQGKPPVQSRHQTIAIDSNPTAQTTPTQILPGKNTGKSGRVHRKSQTPHSVQPS
jgi:hypothetical protein